MVLRQGDQAVTSGGAGRARKKRPVLAGLFALGVELAEFQRFFSARAGLIDPSFSCLS